MAAFFLGFLALAGFLGAAWWFSRQKTARAARLVRMLLGGGAVLAGALLTLRGAVALGVPIGLFGLGMLGIAYSGPGQNGASGSSPPQSGNSMSLDEAREILSVGLGATREEIRQAHRNLMKKLHPDTGGGSAALARQVQEARDILLAALGDQD
ncbi:DnaJ domain-containing protein [Maricaulis salignorans]|uniref:DnaJ domain-containing protein n=1 Tax=Maricaulis salignorans TaxID=144026 RepID=A0A1G9VXA2_9PROT|nr:DnaJ domain-containing protein [Maricaulis salignorans]SDM76922.1 DnaJ domain-containing protein [Maricaulis salignorans]